MPKEATLAETVRNDPRWAAVVRRDPIAPFYYAVKTTGVYCRPGCAARLARPENVQFYTSCAEAEKEGFRPCKRCRPNQPTVAELNAAKIERACRLIESSDEVPNLNSLAKHVAMSEFHFHRSFKAVTGVTPGEYARASRSRRVRANLAGSDSVTDAIYDAGFQSNSSFYDVSNQILGMTPAAFRRGGKGMEIRYALGECSLGWVLAARSDRGVCAILLGDDPARLAHDLREGFPQANLTADEQGYEDVLAKVIRLVEHPEIGLDLPLDIRGTAFQQRVWKALRDIPAGSTASYSEIARKMDSPTSARAVAQACAANTLAIAVPCHRVVRNDGALAGYRWGIDRKQALLGRERRPR